MHPEEAEARQLLHDLARQDPLLEPVADVRQYAVAHELPDGVADCALLVVEQGVERQEVERVERGRRVGCRRHGRVLRRGGQPIVESRTAASGVPVPPDMRRPVRSSATMTAPADRRSLPELLADAEGRIERLDPRDAYAESQGGALLVDVRSEVRRARDGIVPGALHVPLTVFPWRFDPDGLWRSPWVPTTDARVIVFCDDGFSSILAAATLAQLGYARAADVVGGFTAWRESGLPFAPGPGPVSTVPPGMGPPD